MAAGVRCSARVSGIGGSLAAPPHPAEHAGAGDSPRRPSRAPAPPRWVEGERMDRQIIFTKNRDPRLVTVRRGGTLQDADHRLLAVWAADCAQHVLHFFEQTQPSDDRPCRAIEQARAWARGEITM